MSRNDLADLVDSALRARPGIDRHAFAAHLAAVAPDQGELAVDDLALAFAATHGDAPAVAELYAMVERAARPALAVAGYAAPLADDAIQETAIQIVVGKVGAGRPLLLGYQGRARLSLWIKTVALRTAAHLTELSRRLGGDDSRLEELAGAEDPAREVLKAELRPAVRTAFADAVKQLSCFDRELLAAVIVKGETIDDLSRRHGIHRATAARWVGRARAALDEGLRRELAVTLELAPGEVSSVLTAIATSVELTPGRLTDVKQRTRR